MELTRHFVATAYVVVDGATCLHEHDRLDMWLPPGGHVDHGETPHETARREAREETGLEVDLVFEQGDVELEHVRSLPRPMHFFLEDINVCDGEVGHQHVDFVFYGEADTREIAPEGHDEAPPEDWEWFTPAELEASADVLPDDVVEVGKQAIATVEGIEDTDPRGRR